MTAPTIAAPEVLVTVGVDTHADVHVAVTLDQLGRRIGAHSVATTPSGYAELEQWATTLGTIAAFGIEGTGSWGASLVRHLRAAQHSVIEVNRPDRSARRRQGKSDTLDAEAAARAVLAGTATAQPKTADGHVELIRTLMVTRRSAMKARTQTVNQLGALLVTAPAELREQLRSTRPSSWSTSPRDGVPARTPAPPCRSSSWPCVVSLAATKNSTTRSQPSTGT